MALALFLLAFVQFSKNRRLNMSRFLVQSLDTGCFLAPGLEDGQPEWVLSLRDAGGGVVPDYDDAAAMAIEYAEMGERVAVIDLDVLGTANDYD